MRLMTPDEATPSAPHPPSAVPSPQGLVLAPFRALRYAIRPDIDLTRVTSPPYDVIDDDERRELEAADPHNVVRLILPRDEEGLPGSGYRRAAQMLESWRETGLLQADEKPALYVYEMDDQGQRTRGVIGALALVPPDADIVLPHENTMAGTVADRLALTEATNANLETIYLVYDGGGATSAVVAEQDLQSPLIAATAPDGIIHRLWAIRDPATLEAIAADLLPRRAVIADGHHRYATYLRNQADRHARGDGPGPWDFGLVLLVDATAYGPQVHPIHRVVPTLPLPEAVQRARQGFTVTVIDGGERAALAALTGYGSHGAPASQSPSAGDTVTSGGAGRTGNGSPLPESAGPATDTTAFVITDGAAWYLLTDPDPAQLRQVLPADRSEAWRALDVTIAHRYLIEALWGLRDHEDVVGFRHDVASARDAVTATGGTALLLNATPVKDVIAVAAAGERMPRKSTLFTPKPRTGMVMRTYVDDRS